ncbi:MAG: hypothetical protein ABIK92_04530 [Pseudomonadota bacterium]
MSERGSFVTDYIYCDKCFIEAKKLLLHQIKELCSIVIPSWQPGKELPIIAGKVGGLSPSDQIIMFEVDLIPELEKVICHPIRIVLLGEYFEKTYHICPISHP